MTMFDRFASFGLCLFAIAPLSAQDHVVAEAGGVTARMSESGIEVVIEMRDDGEWASIEGSRQTGAFACEGRNVSISGKKNRLTLSGECPFVDISGDGNEVSIEATGEISVAGDENIATWSRSLDGEVPEVHDDGEGNTVTKRI